MSEQTTEQTDREPIEKIKSMFTDLATALTEARSLLLALATIADGQRLLLEQHGVEVKTAKMTLDGETVTIDIEKAIEAARDLLGIDGVVSTTRLDNSAPQGATLQ